MSNVREIGTNFPQLIAEGLEEIARAIRAGEVKPHRAFVVMTVKQSGHDMVGGQFFGADTSMAEIVGMLELAKNNAIEQG